MCGTLVRIWLVDRDEAALGRPRRRPCPRRSSCRSAPGRPRPGSCRRSCASAPSKETLRPSFAASTFVVLVFSITLSKRAALNFCHTATRSRSAPSIRPSIISTTSRRAPSVEYTVPISRPMMPPPMTSSFFGRLFSSSAPVESTMRGSSGRNGSFAACEPAAMIALVKRMVFAVRPPCGSCRGSCRRPAPRSPCASSPCRRGRRSACRPPCP